MASMLRKLRKGSTHQKKAQKSSTGSLRRESAQDHREYAFNV